MIRGCIFGLMLNMNFLPLADIMEGSNQEFQSKMGDYIFKVEWGPLGTFLSCIIRVKTSDPVFYSIHSASADIRIGI